MTTHVLRGWLPGVVLALGAGGGGWLAVSQAHDAQMLRMQQLAEEVASLRRAVQSMSRPPPVPAGSVAAGIPPSVVSGVARPTAEDLDAMALRMVTLLQESGALSEGRDAPRPDVSTLPLSSEQLEAAGRAGTLVDQVVARGRMSVDDVHEIRRELTKLSGRPEADALRRKLVIAINQNRLVPPDDFEGLP
ncbi:hypothetical protein ACN47A_03890 [Myxococcus fulvus]|uniref:hypothetical protein n=1 Tax=Myxococcus fulvus TaxID=33 RepID=UPI003B9C580F